MASLIEKAKTAAEIINNFKKYCTYGQTLVIPEGVEFIGWNVFHKSEGPGYGRYYLTKLELPSTLKVINYEAFAGNTKLEEIKIPHGCEYIYSYAFAGCTGVTTIELPNTLKNIAYGAFYLSSNIVTVILEDGFNCNLDRNMSFAGTNLSVDVIVNMLQALADRSGQSAYSLILGSTNLNKLTLEQIAIATNKNWNLS